MSLATLMVDTQGLRTIERPAADLGAGDVRVRVHLAPITGLDREVAAGRSGFEGVPGHLFVGTVIEANGPEAQRVVGRRVIPRGSWGCGACDQCAAGREEWCPDTRIAGLSGADGGHAMEVVLPARAVVEVDPAITDEAASLLPLLGAIYESVLRVRLPEWTNVLVIGDGSTGLFAATALAAAGYTVTLHGRHGDRFDLVRRYRVNFVLTDPHPDGYELRPGRFGPAMMSYPVVLEASGEAAGWDTALEQVACGGVLLMMSSGLDGVPRPIHRVQEKSVRVMGLRQGDVATAAEVVAQGLFDPTQVINRIFQFAEAERAYKWADTRDAWMPLLRMLPA